MRVGFMRTLRIGGEWSEQSLAERAVTERTRSPKLGHQQI